MKLSAIVFLITLLVGCASHKGAVEPNWGLADFDKHDEAYYLSVDQIELGDSKTEVREAYGDNFRRADVGKNSETWIYASYRATFARDPIDKYVHVRFIDDSVVSVREVGPSGGELSSKGEEKPSQSIEDRLRRLERLKAEGVITDKEYKKERDRILDEL